MSDQRLLGFFDPDPRQTQPPPRSEWGRACAPIRLTEAPFRSYRPATATCTPQPLLQSVVEANARDWFKSWANEWRQATAAHSSMTMRKRDPTYRRIVDLGWPIVPMLLGALRENPDLWFPFLRDITRENPVNRDDRGDYDKMTNAWLTWGRNKGLIS
jgi:hypothetical protein